MAMIGGRQVRDVAKERKKKLEIEIESGSKNPLSKEYGPKKPSHEAEAMSVRKEAEESEGLIRPGSAAWRRRKTTGK